MPSAEIEAFFLCFSNKFGQFKYFSYLCTPKMRLNEKKATFFFLTKAFSKRLISKMH